MLFFTLCWNGKSMSGDLLECKLFHVVFKDNWELGISTSTAVHFGFGCFSIQSIVFYHFWTILTHHSKELAKKKRERGTPPYTLAYLTHECDPRWQTDFSIQRHTPPQSCDWNPAEFSDDSVWSVHSRLVLHRHKQIGVKMERVNGRSSYNWSVLLRLSVNMRESEVWIVMSDRLGWREVIGRLSWGKIQCTSGNQKKPAGTWIQG